MMRTSKKFCGALNNMGDVDVPRAPESSIAPADDDASEPLDAPTEQDYVIYFIINLIESLSNQRKSLINKFAFIDIYYSLVDLIFKIQS